MQMAELRAKPEKTWPWKKDDQSGRPIRFLQFKGVRYVQWDDEKGSVVKCVPVDPGPHSFVPRSESAPWPPNAQPPATVSAPRGSTEPDHYRANYTLSTNTASQAPHNPQTSQHDILTPIAPYSLFQRDSTEDTPRIGDSPEPRDRSVTRRRSSERGKSYHEDRHGSTQAVIASTRTGRPAISRSSSTTQHPISVNEGRTVEATTDPSSCLSRLGQAFVKIGEGQYGTCQNFIDKYPEILKENQNDFQREAIRLQREGKYSMFRTCIQQLLLLRECSNFYEGEYEIYFDRMKKGDTLTLRDFLEKFDKTSQGLKANAALAAPVQQDRRPGAQPLKSTGGFLSRVPAETRHAPENIRRDSGASDLPMSLGNLNLGSHYDQVHLGSHWQADERTSMPRTLTPPIEVQRPTLGSVNEVPRPSFQSDTNSQAGELSIVDATRLDIRGTGEEREELDDRYRKRLDAKKFFVVGRVFAMLWHEGVGDKKGGHISQAERFNVERYNRKRGKYNEEVFSHIRRMVVVRNRHGYCWCIPINTYNYHGVAKKGLSREDREAHSIIYMDDTKPAIDRAERNMMVKIPIAVTAANLEQKLHYMSRLNFGKVYSVEWNVKVMNVGLVSVNSMANFTGYWYNEVTSP